MNLTFIFAFEKVIDQVRLVERSSGLPTVVRAVVVFPLHQEQELEGEKKIKYRF